MGGRVVFIQLQKILEKKFFLFNALTQNLIKGGYMFDRIDENPPAGITGIFEIRDEMIGAVGIVGVASAAFGVSLVAGVTAIGGTVWVMRNIWECMVTSYNNVNPQKVQAILSAPALAVSVTVTMGAAAAIIYTNVFFGMVRH
jgi:hypothetical protein